MQNLVLLKVALEIPAVWSGGFGQEDSVRRM